MSRKCPKRYHFFLDWLKANRSRFAFFPQVLQIRKRKINFGFLGVTSALSFSLETTGSGGPWINVDAVWPDKKDAVWPDNKLEGITRFYGAEMNTKPGWITLCEEPENRRIWRTKEELWAEICCESFLDWCNRELTPNSWVVIYEGFRHSDAKVHKNEASAKDSISAWENGIIEDMGLDTYKTAKLIGEARYFMVPLFKQSSKSVLQNTPAGG